MIKNNSPLQALFEKGDLPGITQGDVINQAHPGYMQAAPDPNVIAPAGTNVFGQPTAPLTQEDLMNMITGMGSPMAMGSVAKGGKSLLTKFLQKLDRRQARSYTPTFDEGFRRSAEEARRLYPKETGWTKFSYKHQKRDKNWRKDINKALNKVGLKEEHTRIVQQNVNKGLSFDDAFIRAFDDIMK